MSTAALMDIHSHFLYGLDDGARTLKDMQTMLDAAHRDGVTGLYATPHVTPGLRPFDRPLFEARLQEARAYCHEQGYNLAIHPGAELLYTPAMPPSIADRRLPTMGDTDMVLVEYLPDVSLHELTDSVIRLEDAGYIPILAHVERYRCLFRGASLRKLREAHDIRIQINAHTLLTKQDFFQRMVISGWLKGELVDFVASDAHNVTSRPFRMQAVHCFLHERYAPEYVRRLVEGTALTEG